jgi:hypothetical protein
MIPPLPALRLLVAFQVFEKRLFLKAVFGVIVGLLRNLHAQVLCGGNKFACFVLGGRRTGPTRNASPLRFSR